MKYYKNLLALMAMSIVVTTAMSQKLTKDERKKALDHLQTTQEELVKTVEGLSEAQLNFTPNEEGWSVAMCVEHIALSENSIFGIVQMTLQNEPDPSLRDSVSMSDDQVIGLITNRSQKVKTREEFEPTGKFGSYQGSLDEFKKKRESNKVYVKNTKDDLRNRYFDFPFGKVDAYQVILFMSGHTQRHTDQIKEVMATEGFPTE